MSGIKTTPAQVILLSFGLAVITGALLLMLPIATVKGTNTWIDALFIATSATCVTGLSVVDIGSEYTLFGQLVVLGLIQAGGLGIITLSAYFLAVFRRRLAFLDRDVINSTLTYSPEPHLGRLLQRILFAVLVIEGAGALLLSLGWSRTMSWGQAVYNGIFHSVSAFCNAGFSLFPDNLERFKTDPFINVVLMLLIITGGLGFIVLLDLRNLFFRSGTRLKDISSHSKMVLLTSAFLILGGTMAFFFLEHANVLKGYSVLQGLLIACFQSVTARTCGFNTVSIGQMTDASCLVFMILMFIGAAPGSTGGGVKVTTFGIIVAMVFSRFKGMEETSAFYRTIPRETVNKALIVVLGSIVIIGGVFFLLLLSETRSFPAGHGRNIFESLLFETISAFGTVGLSMGVTPGLTSMGKIFVIFLMFIGRIGPLTLVLAMTPGAEKKGRFRYARGDFMVG
jgi:trk system potassium uptake protein TrkH